MPKRWLLPLCLGLSWAGSLWAQPLARDVELTVAAFPSCEVYLETPQGRSRLARSGQPTRVSPPVLRDANGVPAQYAPGTLVLLAADHGELRVPVAASDWTAGRLPAQGFYRLPAATPLVALLDIARAYPLALGAGGLMLVLALAAGMRWRSLAGSRARQLQQLSSQLHTTGDPLIGKQLGNYQVVARLGQGGMGSVYRVRADGGDYAAKVLYFSPQDGQELERFRREFKVLSQLRHFALPRAYDYAEAEGMAYCVMELVEGKTLNHYIRPGGLPWDSIWPWVQDILLGLECAHEQGIVHRDLKPANLMVTSGRVKILDFGLARQTDLTAVTLTGQGFGTPTYMAPEQVSASGTEVDPRSDLYSLGIILFELLTGQPPFRGDEVQEVVAQHMTRVPPRVSSLVSGVPSAVDEAIAVMLAKKPANRYPNVARVREVLTAAPPAPTAHPEASPAASSGGEDTVQVRRPR